MPDPFPQGLRGACSLTYDDALPCHIGVADELHRFGLHGTFYLPAANEAVTRLAADWRRVAARGHELGNHTCFHPCRRGPEPRWSWLDPAYDLKAYSAKRFTDEVALANRIIGLVDGQPTRSFGNTCHNESIGPDDAQQDIRPLLAKLVVAARGPCDQAVILPGAGRRFGLGCWGGDRLDHRALAAIAQRAVDAGGWTIICMHGVGQGTHGLFVETAEHTRLCETLAAIDGLWCAPVATVAQRWVEAGII